MSNQYLKLRRSAVAGKVPDTSSLDFGELAINTYDGQLFLKKSGSQGEIVTVVGSTGSFTGSFIGNGAGLIDIPASGITGLNLSRIATGSVSASVNTDISASFRLTSGSNTLLNITKDGFVWIGNGSFVNQGYQLDIQGNTRVNGRLLLGTSTDSGVWQLDVKGDTQISGNVIMSGSNKWIEFRGGPVIIAPTNFSGWAGTSIAGHASGDNSFSIGGAASGTNSHTFGKGSIASATNSHAIGYGTQAVGFASIAIGTGARAGANEFVVGYPYDGGTSNVYFGSGTNRWNGNVQISGSGYSYTINGSGAYGIDFLGGNITIAGGKGTGTGSAGDVIFSTSTPLTTGNTLQSLTERWWIKGQTGTLTNKGTSSLAMLDVSGSSVFTGSVLITGSTVSLTGGSFSGSGANLYGIPASGITGLNLSQIATGSVTASVNTDISASFRITSASNTLVNVTKDGQLWVGNGSFVNQGYQADIQGTTRVNGVLTNTDSYLQIPNSNGLQIGFFSNSAPGTKSNISITNSGTGGSGTAQAFPIMTGLRNIFIVGTDLPAGLGSPTIRGNDNLILGRPSIFNPLSGNSNTIINSNGQISVGSGNTGIGMASLAGITSGSNNLHITIGAGIGNGTFTSTLSNSVYIGDPVKSNNNTTVAGDIVITSPYTATTQFWFGGKSDATDVYFNTPAQTGTNQTGAIQYWRASLGTGTGTAGKTIFQHSIPTTSGTTIHSSFTNTLTLETNRVSISGSLSISGTEFNNTSSITSAGITTVSQLSTSSYTSCFYNYTVASASNARSGQVMTVWNGSNIRYTEVVTTDIGDTSLVLVSASLSSGFVRLQVSASTSGWTFKNISNLL